MRATFSTLLTFVLSSISLAAGEFLPADYDISKGSYDYIVVGGGTAGNVIANRLSEDPRKQVLVIEAGPPETDFINGDPFIPYRATFLAPDTIWDWNFTTTEQEGLNGRSIPYARGHILGGSSGINYMLYTRASSDDYDRYANVTGDDGWSWDNMQKYFRRNERWTEPNDHHNTTGQFDPAVHSKDGIVSVSLQGFPSAIDDMVVDAANELGGPYHFNLDMNSGMQLGLGWPQLNINGPKRDSSASSYLSDKFQRRKNLHVMTNTRVTRLLQSGKYHGNPEFKTVEYQAGKGTKKVNAKTEVILSAGSVMTPHILLHSGIGDKNELQAVGIKPLVNLPDVGKNLEDHPLLLNNFFVASNDTRDIYFRNETLQQELLEQWLANGTGEYLVDSVLGHVAFFHLEADDPVFQLAEDPAAGPGASHWEFITNNGRFFPVANDTGNYISVATIVTSPTSRGTITINSTNPLDAPVIDPALLASDYDKAVMVEAVKGAMQFLTAPSFKGYIVAPADGLEDAHTDNDLLQYVSDNSRTIQHPTGTAFMSAKGANNGVVDPDLTVKNVSGLRIVDASVFPFIPSAHTMVPTYVFAERATDLIKAKYHKE